VTAKNVAGMPEVQFIRDVPARILLVAGEPMLQMAYRQRWFQNHDYTVSYASSSAEALVFLETYCADVILIHAGQSSDGIVTFCEQVAEVCPESTRVMIGDKQERRAGFEAVACGAAHQFHCIEWMAEPLQSLIAGTLELHRGLVGRHLQQTLSPFLRLPSNIASQFKLRQLLVREDSSLTDLAHEIEKVPALAAKILQIANSVCYGLRRHVVSVSDAIVFIGLEHIGTMLVAIELFESAYRGLNEETRAHVDLLWNRALRRAQLARDIATRIGDKDLSNRAFIAAMFQDIGFLIRITQQKRRYSLMLRIVNEVKCSMGEADRQCFVVPHEEVGAMLLRLWNYPPDIIRAVEEHHRHRVDSPELHQIITTVDVLDMPHEIGALSEEDRALLELWRLRLWPEPPIAAQTPEAPTNPEAPAT
jgi:HD-like signal output (HDOD) protein